MIVLNDYGLTQLQYLLTKIINKLFETTLFDIRIYLSLSKVMVSLVCRTTK